MKIALIFFTLGMVQGAILLDWFHAKQDLNLVVKKGKK